MAAVTAPLTRVLADLLQRPAAGVCDPWNCVIVALVPMQRLASENLLFVLYRAGSGLSEPCRRYIASRSVLVTLQSNPVFIALTAGRGTVFGESRGGGVPAARPGGVGLLARSRAQPVWWGFNAVQVLMMQACSLVGNLPTHSGRVAKIVTLQSWLVEVRSWFLLASWIVGHAKAPSLKLLVLTCHMRIDKQEALEATVLL